jgi:hypothetical protein
VLQIGEGHRSVESARSPILVSPAPGFEGARRLRTRSLAQLTVVEPGSVCDPARNTGDVADSTVSPPA